MTLYVLDSHKEMVDSWRDRHGTLHKRDRTSKRLHTADMTPRELARVVAGFHGWTADNGGWIHSERDEPIVQGWSDLGGILELLGIIEVGKGVHWRRMQILAEERGLQRGSRHYTSQYSKIVARLVKADKPLYYKIMRERYEGVKS